MTKFEICYELTGRTESGYSNEPDDKGGETYCGVSRINNPNWLGWKIIDERNKVKKLKRYEIIYDNKLDNLLKEFFRTNYFDKNRLGEIDNQKIINEVYDIGVNFGTHIAAIFLQQSLNLLNRNQKDFKDIMEDGKIGNETIKTVNNYTNSTALLKTLNGLSFMRYTEICRYDKTQENNFIGWLTRIEF